MRILIRAKFEKNLMIDSKVNPSRETTKSSLSQLELDSFWVWSQKQVKNKSDLSQV